MRSSEEPAQALAHRLRELREERGITQAQLAEALSEHRTVSPALISSWENAHTVPPPSRLVDYATFFATSRSAEDPSHRLLTDAELTEPERARRDRLAEDLRELKDAQVAAHDATEAPLEPGIEHLGGPWAFPDGRPVTLVCAELPEQQRQSLPRPGDPERAYAAMYEYADLDALFELHGHIRAANPTSLVRVRKASTLKADHYTTHLVVLGGVDWNPATEKLLDILDLPVTQEPGSLSSAHFEAKTGDDTGRFAAGLAKDGSVASDVGHFFRSPNPLNGKRTVTICNAISSLGVLGTVRALTDERFRDRNGDYLAERLSDSRSYSLLMRIQILPGNTVITPDWTSPGTRLHEWTGEVS